MMPRCVYAVVLSALCGAIGCGASPPPRRRPSPATPPPAALPHPDDVLATLHRVFGAFSRDPVGHPVGGADWTWATYMLGVVQLHAVTGDGALRAYAEDWADANGWKLPGYNFSRKETRTVVTPPGGAKLLPPPVIPSGPTNANNELAGAVYVDLYLLDGPARNATKINDTLRVLATQVARSETADWTWLDALHMAMGTFARACNVTGDDRYCAKMDALYDTAALAGPPDGVSRFAFYSPGDSLFYRDDSYIGARDPAGEKIFWARGNGWALAALAYALQWLPAGWGRRAEYAGKFVVLAERLRSLHAAHQAAGSAPDGCWRASLTNPGRFPNPETTGTALFTYGMAWGVNHGYLRARDFEPVLASAWGCLSGVAVQEPSGQLGYCQPGGGQPAPAYANFTDDYCVGNFLMAGTELVRLLRAKE